MANNLSLNAQKVGSSVIIVCASANSCSSLSVTVTALAPTNNPPVADNSVNKTNSEIKNITSEATIMVEGNLTTILSNAQAAKNTQLETINKNLYLNSLVKGLKLTTTQINSLNYFITYGTASTKKLDASDRAATLGSYFFTYKTLPTNATQWSDLFSVISCLMPTTKSASAETQAKLEFKKIYSRNADLSNAYDNGMIMITAYGLRPTRNLAAEKKAILKFKSIYNHAPLSPLAWNLIRAIAYSGVSK